MTKSEAQENAHIVSLGCIVCRVVFGVYSPSEIHHIRRLATSKKRDNAPKIPLCPSHHRHGGYGVAIHAGRETWERNFGDELEFLRKTEDILLGKSI